jgi:hypothetical protein
MATPLTNPELKFIEAEIKETRININKTFRPVNEIEPGHFMTYDQEELDQSLIHHLQRLFILMTSYFEGKGLNDFASQFRKEFSETMVSKEKLLATEEYDGDSYLVMNYKLNQYLYPFKAFSSKSAKEDDGFEKLISIVGETPHILSQFGNVIKNEADIYKRVQWVLNFYFDTRPTRKTRFISKFKIYRPDILIPELETAIEYKLVKKRDALDDYIDQLGIDADNYRGDPFYREFIAVICLKGNIATKRDIEIAWKGKQFDEHWHPVVVSI